ncbi:transcriptional regulator [Moraxella caviae]|nr:helix-turn-helix transcriptional regulator [Moraxella caviae]OOR89471.1 transcriptional regulator [Moraxella caviae]
MDLQSTFCRRFKQARKAKNLSQEKLGVLIGLDEFVASTRINRYEKGVHLPDLTTLQNIAHALDVPSAYFFADDELTHIILAHHHKTNTLKTDTP